ncbi:MAG: T9SS type A sorting domain-containing protein [Flavobacteriales bacterium]|nr:T9SS type A sorting domain-containing protein [Flavobacteriales bacterium]
MKRLLPFSLVALTCLAIGGTVWHADRTPAYTERAGGLAQGADGMRDYMNMLRRNVVTGQVDPNDYLRAFEAARSYSASQAKSVGFQWLEMGPNNVGGRTRSICIHPSAPNTIWAGAVSGGLWKSEDGANTWFRVQGLSESLVISSVAVTNSGHIYVATGHSAEGSGGSGGSGFIGHGIFRSVDGGASFSLVIGPSAPWSANADWAITNKIVADPTDANKLYVAHNSGFKIYDEAANTFTTPPAPFPQTSSFCSALEVVKDSTGVTAILLRTGTQNWRSVDGGNTFQQIPQGSGLPTSGYGRLEFAISIQDHNYMYALAEQGGSMRGGWRSTDGGVTWSQFWPSGNDVPSLDIFGDNNQGWYDIVIAVNPNDKEEVMLGGVTLWKWGANSPPEQIAIAQNFPGCFVCVHADIHELTWSPDGTSLYVGCDGGVYKSFGVSPNFVFTASNHNFNVTQFYSASISPKGKVLGGTQDNGTQYIPLFPGNEQRASEVGGGDGFDCEISQLDPNILFGTVYAGALARSNNEGGVSGGFYDTRILALGDPGDITGNGLGDFYTNIRLYENALDLNSPDSGLYSVQWIVEDNDFTVGDTIGDPFPYNSRKMPAVPLPATVWSLDGFPAGTTANTVYDIGDTVRYLITLPDRVETLFAVGFSGTDGVWATRDACTFTGSVEWWKVAGNAGGNVNVLEWSSDGQALYWGTTEGDVWRVKGFNNAYTSSQADDTSSTRVLEDPVQIYNGGGTITGLCSDPNDASRLLITVGGYGGSGKVRLCDNALNSAPPFNVVNKWNNLPADLVGMPVYDGIIHVSSSNLYVVGTEFGVMVSDDGGQNWAFENTNMELVPTMQVRQQTWNWQNNPHGPDFVTNPGVVYLGTHGRGFWRSETLLGIVPPGGEGSDVEGSGGLLVFPNPVNDLATVGFKLRGTAQVQATVYDLNGRAVRNIAQQRMSKGEQRLTFDVSDLSSGTYIIDLRVDGTSRTGRFVVSR